MSRLPELKGELSLIRIRRAEIASMKHPSECKDEYIRLARREAEIIGEIEYKYMEGSHFRRKVFGI